MLSEYRRRFIDYRSTMVENALLARSGLRRGSEQFALFREQRDLFTAGAIGALRETAAEGSSAEKAGSRRLLGLAIDGHLTSAALEIDEELERQSADPRVRAAPGLLDDLYGERLDLLARAAKGLGYPDLLRLRSEVDGVDYESLVGVATQLLEATERPTERGLAALLHRERQLAVSQATRADLAALELASEGRTALRFETRLARYADLFAGLGFRTDQQTGIEFCRFTEDPPAFDDLPLVWPIRLPARISLGYYALDGRFAERAFWQAAGAAQLAAWTSPPLPPEFQYPTVAGDQATPLAWGMLFGQLLGERHWLTGPFSYADTAHFRSGVAALRRLELRLAAARLIYEVEYLQRQVATRASDRYRELLGLALLTSVEADDYRRGIGRVRGLGVVPATTHFGLHPLGAASLLRAAAFESQCREHLKSSFGADWWNNRRAGDTLIDIWNTGYRYPLEELAGLVGFGPLDYQWLIEELQRENNDE
jgi:hypothetical protein